MTSKKDRAKTIGKFSSILAVGGGVGALLSHSAGVDWVMNIILPWAERGIVESNPSRFFESLLLLYVAWWRLKPWMAKQIHSLGMEVHEQLTGLTTAITELTGTMKAGFAAGDKRFQQLEDRVTNVESVIKAKGGSNG